VVLFNCKVGGNYQENRDWRTARASLFLLSGTGLRLALLSEGESYSTMPLATAVIIHPST
jgi:hypothetical protein